VLRALLAEIDRSRAEAAAALIEASAEPAKAWTP
jgi:hypothetical protein